MQMSLRMSEEQLYGELHSLGTAVSGRTPTHLQRTEPGILCTIIKIVRLCTITVELQQVNRLGP